MKSLLKFAFRSVNDKCTVTKFTEAYLGDTKDGDNTNLQKRYNCLNDLNINGVRT